MKTGFPELVGTVAIVTGAGKGMGREPVEGGGDLAYMP